MEIGCRFTKRLILKSDYFPTELAMILFKNENRTFMKIIFSFGLGRVSINEFEYIFYHCDHS